MMNMFVLVKVLLSIVLFFTKCNSSLFGRALDNDATYSSVNLFTNGENRSTIGNYSLLGITANSFSEVIHGSAVPQFVSPSSLSSASTFDRQLLQDMRDMPTSFKSPMSNASEFITAVRIGRCKAMCLLLLAPDLGRLRNNRGFLTDANCGNNEKCRICEAACEVPEDGCDQQCKSRAECTIACNFRKELAQTVLTSSAKLADLRLDRPRAICFNYVKKAAVGFLFKWSLFNTTSRLYLSSSVPVVFIVEHRSRPQDRAYVDESWRVLGMLSQGLMPIFVPPGGQYQYRITPVTVDGVLAARVSRWTSVPQEPGRFEAPTEVRVVQQRGSSLGITASIALTHKGLPSCQYSIYILPQSERARQIYSRSEPYDLFQKDLDKLEFAMNYTLIIRSTDFTGEEKGEAFRLPFETLTCLDAFRHNFSSCAPGPPSLVSVTGTRRGLRITWNPPPYTSPDNPVMGYWLAIKKNAHLNWARNSAPLNITRYVNASVNYVEESLDADHYVVSVRAVSNAGIGARAEKYYHLRFSSKGFSDHLFSIAISCVSIGCTLIIVSAIIWSNIKAKREAKRIDGVETFTNMNLNTSDTRADYIPAEIESRMRKAYKKKKLFLRSQNSELFSAVHQRVRGVGVLLNNPLYGLHERRERFLLEKVEECLGSGAFGQVYKAIVRIDGKKEVLALKMPNKNLPPEERKAFRQEIEFLKRVGSHPNIVGLRGFCLEENNASMLIEYCPFGDLKTYLDRIRNELESASLSETKMTSFAWQISSGMEYLAERRLVHRDLAARNILLESDAKVKITDFGLSRDIYTEGLYYKRSAGKLPFRWMALESFSRAEYSEKSDVWSFGVLMWEIATFGEQPFGALPPDVVIEQLRQGVRLHQPETCSIELYEIMKACWHESPDGRPTFSQLKQQLDALLVQTQEYFSFDG